jgi:hypothetical protein
LEWASVQPSEPNLVITIAIIIYPYIWQQLWFPLLWKLSKQSAHDDKGTSPSNFNVLRHRQRDKKLLIIKNIELNIRNERAEHVPPKKARTGSV